METFTLTHLVLESEHSGETCQCHVCWCTVSFCCQDISSNCIVYAGSMDPCLPRRRKSSACAISSSRNERSINAFVCALKWIEHYEGQTPVIAGWVARDRKHLWTTIDLTLYLPTFFYRRYINRTVSTNRASFWPRFDNGGFFFHILQGHFVGTWELAHFMGYTLHMASTNLALMCWHLVALSKSFSQWQDILFHITHSIDEKMHW